MFHISFDLWNTLIKPNPYFRKRRAEIFHSDYNKKELSLTEVENLIHKIGKNCNLANEFSGESISSSQMYSLVLAELGNKPEDFLPYDSKLNLKRVKKRMNELFFLFPPTVYDENTFDVLETLQKIKGASFSLLSNTGYLAGDVMELFLKNEIKNQNKNIVFDFMLFSETEKKSKPNQKLFKKIQSKVDKNKKIYHIGDNPHADQCNINGINCIIINNASVNSYSILNLLTLIGD